MKSFLEKTATAAPFLIVGITLFVTIAALVSLVLSDVITGQVTGTHISTNQWFGLFVSFATTGMLIGCGGLLFRFWSTANYAGFAVVFFVFASLQSADVYFDAVSVDIMRFGKIVLSSDVPGAAEAMAHNIYRFLVGGISLVGEPLAIGSLVMFPALKKFINSFLTDARFIDKKNPVQAGYNSQQYPKSKYRPLHKPSYQGYQTQLKNYNQREFTPENYDEL